MSRFKNRLRLITNRDSCIHFVLYAHLHLLIDYLFTNVSMNAEANSSQAYNLTDPPQTHTHSYLTLVKCCE